MEDVKKEPKVFTISTKGKPHLHALYEKDAKKAAEVVGLFVQLMEEACSPEKSGIPWVNLPQLFDERNLTLSDLVKGVLHGALDVKAIHPDNFDVWQEELHPLSMLAPRPNYLTGEMREYDWRTHFRLPHDAKVDQRTIEDIFRKLLRYYKYVDVDALAHALINNQVKTFEGLGERNVKTLPFTPALRYQQEKLGDLQVGKFFEDVGFFDGGYWEHGDSHDCPACHRPDVIKINQYNVCTACNIGFKLEESP